MNEMLLDIRNLRVEFQRRQGAVLALDDISLSLRPGQVMGVVGESGAGKSLIGSSVIGLLPSSARIAGGEIRFAGSRIDNLSERQFRSLRGRKIGAIFQDPMTTLNPLLTIGDQLEETMLRHLPLSRREASNRAVRWLEKVGISSAGRRVKSYPHEFSGGMRQRAVIALALCAEPKLVIADEPTTALDVSIQSQIIHLLKALVSESELGMIIITHDMGVVAEIADTVAVIYAGRLVEIGAVDAILGSASHPYTEALMAAIPPLDRRLERLEQIDGSMPALSHIPAGCAFRPRCRLSFDRCHSRPVLLQAGNTRAACWLASEARPQ